MYYIVHSYTYLDENINYMFLPCDTEGYAVKTLIASPIRICHSLTNRYYKGGDDIIEFNGKLDVEYINTNGHPPLEFEVKGILSTNQNEIKGTGRLEHISSRGTFSCLLTLKFNLKLKDLGLKVKELNLKEDIQIEIVQIVLNKSADQ